MRRSLCLLAAAAVVLGTSGCASVLMEGAKKTAEDRHTSDFLTDAQIGTSLFSALAQKEAGLVMDVNVDVWEQRVLLTGTVADARTKAGVAQLARADKRVRRVYDEIQIVSAAELASRRAAAGKRESGNKEGFERIVNDYWIETKITGQLIGTRDVSSFNLRWRSVRNVVCVIGRASTPQEHRRVMDSIRSIEGVQQVKSFVEVKQYP